MKPIILKCILFITLIFCIGIVEGEPTTLTDDRIIVENIFSGELVSEYIKNSSIDNCTLTNVSTIKDASDYGMVYGLNFNDPVSNNMTFKGEHIAFDRSAYANDGVIINATYGENGYNNNGYLTFNGSGYIKIQDSDSLEIGSNDFSVSMWVKIGAWDNGRIINKYHPYNIYAASDNTIKLQLYNGRWLIFDQSTDELNSDEWYNLVWTLDRDGYSTLYINGEVSGNRVYAGHFELADLSFGEDLYIASGEDKQFFTGCIGEVSEYKRVLDSEEINAVYERGDGFKGSPISTSVYYGSTYGPFNATAPLRKITSDYSQNLYVGEDGQYDSIQDAINDVPFIIRHPYRIYVSGGIYDEDLYIPPFVGSVSSANEGSVGSLEIRGTEDNRDDVKIKSIQINGAHGINLGIHNMQIYGKEPLSDENISISIYGSGTVELRNINFSAGVQSAILGYSVDGLYITKCTFNGQDYATRLKRCGRVTFGDTYLSQLNSGYVSKAIVVGDGIFNIASRNVISPNLVDFDGFDGIEDDGMLAFYQNYEYATRGFNRNVHFINNITLTSPGGSNYTVWVDNTGTLQTLAA